MPHRNASPPNSPTGSIAERVVSAEFAARQRLPWEFALLALGVVVLNHWLAAELLVFLSSLHDLQHASAWLLLLVSAVGFVVAAAWLHRQRLHHHTTSVWWFVLALASADSCGLALHEIVQGVPQFLTFIIGVPLLVWAVRRLKHWKQQWTTIVTLSRQLSRERCRQKPVRHLVLFLSPPNIVPDIPNQPASYHARFPLKDKEGKPKDPVDLTGDLDADVKIMDRLGFHNWQQLLRGIQPHRDNLTDVYLVSSPDTTGQCSTPRAAGEKAEFTEGTYLYRELGKRFLKRYLTGVRIHLSRAVDFEDSYRLLPLLQRFQKAASRRAQLGNLAIDVTSGQKTNSIVAAALSLLSDCTVQYVQTAPRPAAAGPLPPGKPEIEAYLYDLRLDLPAELA
jgi:hypothetical protein